MRVTAARLTEHGQPLQVEEVDLAEPGPREVVMSAAIGEAPRAVAAGQMSVPVDEMVPLAQVNEAFGRITGRQSRGKIVLDTRG